MATGRTVNRYVRAYVNGHDLSAYSNAIGPLDVDCELADFTATMADPIRNYLISKASPNAGTLTGLFDSTATVGINAIMDTAGVLRRLMVPVGIRAAPALGDPVFCGVFGQKGFNPGEANNAMIASIPFVEWDAASLINYHKPWGVLLHANSQETAANTAIGIDDTGLASTAKGGWMMYQIFASNAAGTVTLSVQDSDTNVNADFDPLANATTTAIGFAAIPCAGVIPMLPTGATAVVRQYIRWQLAFAGGMDHVTFAMAFIRDR